MNTYFKGVFFSIFATSCIVNLLMLASPVFLLLIYGNVLPTKSTETLTVLTILVLAIYIFQGIIDYVRGRIIARIGAQIQNDLEEKILLMEFEKNTAQTLSLSHHTQRIQSAFSSPAISFFIDALWTPLFIFTAFIFHPWIGIYSVVAIGILITAAALNGTLNKARLAELNERLETTHRTSHQFKSASEIVKTQGMQERVARTIASAKQSDLQVHLSAHDHAAIFTNLSKSLRHIAQSGILALGAYLVLTENINAGIMIAGSILLGRALQPIDGLIGYWTLLRDAFSAWKKLSEHFPEFMNSKQSAILPIPKGHLSVEKLYLGPNKDSLILKNVSFDLNQGETLGILGESASGKTTLVRAILGVLRPLSGKIQIDGAAITQFQPNQISQIFGYVPQHIQFLEGSISDNISKFSTEENRHDLVIKAATLSGAHEFITSLPEGYNTQISQNLSEGQKQLIALARSLYELPRIIILDQANAQLDGLGNQKINNLINKLKQAKRTVIVVSNNASMIKNCDKLIVLENGLVRSFGETEIIMKKHFKNIARIEKPNLNPRPESPDLKKQLPLENE